MRRPGLGHFGPGHLGRGHYGRGHFGRGHWYAIFVSKHFPGQNLPIDDATRVFETEIAHHAY